MNRLVFAIARVGLGLMIVCATLVSAGSSASATEESYVQLVSGGDDSCGLLVSGSVKCWGRNPYGQLGLGYTSSSVSSPTVVPGLTDVASLVLVDLHTCAVLVSGSVKCWGDNGYGELGLGYTGGSVSSPSVVPGLTDVASLVAGDFHTCAVLVSGSVKCWGYNSHGQLGLGYTSESVSSPTVVPGLTDVASLVAGYLHTCAVLVSGSVKCWGYNSHDQLGVGYTSQSVSFHSQYVSSPTVVPGLTDVASLVSGVDHTCAVLVSGSVKCWGNNGYGQLGLGYTGESVSSPTVVPGISIQRGLVAPTSLAATSVGATSVTVTFPSPTDVTADNPITAYEYSFDGGTTWITPVVPVTASPLTISGLAYATAYSIKVRAVKAQGPGEASEAISVTTLAIPASAPSITSVVTSAGKVTLSIAAPSVLGDTTLTGYDYSINNGSTWSHFGSVTGPFTITGLTNATAYQVKVRAVNSAGAGEASSAVAVNPTKLIPAKPVIASVVGGNASATVSITTPTDVTAQSITGYQYSINKGATYQNAVVSNGSFSISGLTNGVSTSVQIRATNFNGNSLASVAKAVVPATSPAAPTITTITPSAGALSIAFTPPNTGGSAITSYQYSLDGGSTWVVPAKAIKASPIKVTGLPNATAYQVKIRAVNSKGTGSVSDAVSASTPVLVPSAPLTTSIAKSSTTFTVDVTAPVNNGGGSITNYAFSVDSGKTWTVVSPASNSTHIVITGLKANTFYPVQIAAINSAGRGAPSAKYNAGTLR
jgi:alpha-tubulin suppressor-like RCC1 family protein